jgi:hypothetical protein
MFVEGQDYALTAAEYVTVPVESYYAKDIQDFIGVRFVLDGVTYEAHEDDNDGYRSRCVGPYMVEGVTLANTFPAVTVTARHQDRPVNNEYAWEQEDDIWVFTNLATGLECLRVGTANIDDYYPSYVCEISPYGLGEIAG